MVTKALSTLNALKAQSPNDPFIGKKADEAKSLLEEVTGAQKQNEPAPKLEHDNDKSQDDLDILFQQKKKW